MREYEKRLCAQKWTNRWRGKVNDESAFWKEKISIVREKKGKALGLWIRWDGFTLKTSISLFLLVGWNLKVSTSLTDKSWSENLPHQLVSSQGLGPRLRSGWHLWRTAPWHQAQSRLHGHQTVGSEPPAAPSQVCGERWQLAHIGPSQHPCSYQDLRV